MTTISHHKLVTSPLDKDVEKSLSGIRIYQPIFNKLFKLQEWLKFIIEKMNFKDKNNGL